MTKISELLKVINKTSKRLNTVRKVDPKRHFMTELAMNIARYVIETNQTYTFAKSLSVAPRKN